MNEVQTFINKLDIANIDKHPNILIAARLWDDARYDAAKTCYRFMRMIDDMIDDRKAEVAELSKNDKQKFEQKIYQLIQEIKESDTNDPFINKVLHTIDKFKIPLNLFFNFGNSMLYDINHTGFKNMDQFIEYAEGASVAPAAIFVHLCCLQEENGEYLPFYQNAADLARPCALFSYLVHIVRDFEKDQKENLNYFPTDLLLKYSITSNQLRKMAEGGMVTEGFRKMLKEYCELAKKYRSETIQTIHQLENQIDNRYFNSLKLIFNLYELVFNKINFENGSFTTEELNPNIEELKATIEQTLIVEKIPANTI